jgi:hypothetical protein
MKNLKLLVWLTQLGLSVAVPPAMFILLSLWLRDSCGWGGWVLWVGIVLGMVSAIDGLRTSLKAMSRLSKNKKQEDHPVSFNEHN